jgi:hypothetical protein
LYLKPDLKIFGSFLNRQNIFKNNLYLKPDLKLFGSFLNRQIIFKNNLYLKPDLKIFGSFLIRQEIFKNNLYLKPGLKIFGSFLNRQEIFKINLYLNVELNVHCPLTLTAKYCDHSNCKLRPKKLIHQTVTYFVYVCSPIKFGVTNNLHYSFAWPTAPRWFLARLIFDPEDGSNTFLRNVGSDTEHTAPYHRRWQHL